MTCNTAIDYGDQDEWTPYIAFPLHNTKERLFSYHMKHRDKMLSNNNSCVSPPNETPSVLKKQLLVKLNLCIPENLYNNDDKSNGKVTEKYSLNKISTCSFSNEKTVQVWDKLKESCKTKSRTCWQDSLENSFFLRTLGVDKKPTSYDNEIKDAYIWNLQRCTCKDFREMNSFEKEGRLDGMIDNHEECISPCLCPKYFISKSGLVFGSLEEKQRFDEKMDKMDQVFKSELKTIKEQHERLRVDLIPKLQDKES